MNTFEYVSVMHSIVLALGIARLLGGFADIVRHWRELDSKWFFLGWLTLLLALHMGWWFGLWARFHSITDIALTTYVVWFTIPAVLFIASRLLVPDFRDVALPDLGRRFREVRVPFFSCLAVPMILEIPGLISGAPPTQWLIVTFGILAASGAIIRDERWHRILLGLMPTVYATFMVLARASLGA